MTGPGVFERNANNNAHFQSDGKEPQKRHAESAARAGKPAELGPVRRKRRGQRLPDFSAGKMPEIEASMEEGLTKVIYRILV